MTSPVSNQSISMTIAGNPVAFKPKKQHVEKQDFREKARQIYTKTPLRGGITLDIVFYMECPKSIYEKVAKQELVDHVSTPRLSDLEKFVENALQHVVFYDPNQVIKIRSEKIYDLNPRTDIIIHKA